MMTRGRSNKSHSKKIVSWCLCAAAFSLHISPSAAQSTASADQPNGYTQTQSTTDIPVPKYALDQLVCDIDNATCQKLGPDYGLTPEYLKVCFEQYDDNGDLTNNFYSCKPLCDKYHDDDVGENYRRHCDNPDNCPEYVDHCLGVGPTQPPTKPPRDIPFSPEECCNADDEICQSDAALLENCSDMCYHDNVDQGVTQRAACKHLCTSDDHIKLVQCDNECPNYNNSCRRHMVTVKPSSGYEDEATKNLPDIKLIVGITVAVVVVLAGIGVAIGRALCKRRNSKKQSGGRGADPEMSIIPQDLSNNQVGGVEDPQRPLMTVSMSNSEHAQ